MLRQRLGLSPTVLARLFTVSKDTIRQATGESRQLMDQHGHTLTPAAAHLSTLAGLFVYAAAHGVTLTPQTKPTP